MRAILLICCGLLLLALADLPIGFYTFLRIVVTFGALMVVVNEYKKGINFWKIIFGIILILFNPILPIYLNNKEAWMPIDIIAMILFGIKAITFKPDNAQIKNIKP